MPVRPSKKIKTKQMFLVPTRFFFFFLRGGGAPLFFNYLFLEKLERTKTNNVCFHFVWSKTWLLSMFSYKLRPKLKILVTLGPYWIGQIPCRIYFESSLLAWRISRRRKNIDFRTKDSPACFFFIEIQTRKFFLTWPYLLLVIALISI